MSSIPSTIIRRSAYPFFMAGTLYCLVRNQFRRASQQFASQKLSASKACNLVVAPGEGASQLGLLPFP
jgi:hypothetical protein